MDPVVVLIVDDHPPTLHTLAAILAAEDYRVLVAGCAAEGLDRIRDCDPQVVISDVSMPGLDGFDFCRQIRDSVETGTLPVFLYSSSSLTQAQQALARELGVAGVFLKPVAVDELLRSVELAARYSRPASLRGATVPQRAGRVPART